MRMVAILNASVTSLSFDEEESLHSNQVIDNIAT